MIVSNTLERSISIATVYPFLSSKASIFHLPGCPHIYHDEKSRQYQEYPEEFSGNIMTVN